MGKSKWKYFYGCIAPNLLEQPSYQGEPQTVNQVYELTLASARKMVRDLIGKPIRTEHDNIDCGVITNSWIKQSKPKQWWIQMAIDEAKPVGANQVDMIQAGVMRGLSLTHNRLKLYTKEVSLCRTPAREGAGIIPVDESQDFEQEPPMEAEPSTESKSPDSDVEMASTFCCKRVRCVPQLVCASKDTITINYGGVSMPKSADQVNKNVISGLPSSVLSEAELEVMATQQQQQQPVTPAPQTSPTLQTPQQPPAQNQQVVNPVVQAANQQTWPTPAPTTTQLPQNVFQFFPQGPGQQQQQHQQGMPSQIGPLQHPQSGLPQTQHAPLMLNNYPPTPTEQFQQQYNQQDQRFAMQNRQHEMHMQGKRSALGMPQQAQLDQFARNAGMMRAPQGNENYGQNQHQQHQQHAGSNAMDVDGGAQPNDMLQQLLNEAGQPQQQQGQGVAGQAGMPQQPQPMQQTQQQQAPQTGDAQQQQQSAQTLQNVLNKLVNKNVLSVDDKKVLLQQVNGMAKELKEAKQNLQEFEADKIKDREQFRTLMLSLMSTHSPITPEKKAGFEKAVSEGKYDELLRTGGKELMKASSQSLQEHQILLNIRASAAQNDPSLQLELERFNALMNASATPMDSSGSLGPMGPLLNTGFTQAHAPVPSVQPTIPGQFMFTPPDMYGQGGGLSPMPLFSSNGVYTPDGRQLVNFQPQQQQPAHFGMATGGGYANPSMQAPVNYQQQQQMQQFQAPVVQASGATMQYTHQQQLQMSRAPQQQGAPPQNASVNYTQKMMVTSTSPDVQAFFVQASQRLRGQTSKTDTISWASDFGRKAGDALYGQPGLANPNAPVGESVGNLTGRKRRASMPAAV